MFGTRPLCIDDESSDDDPVPVPVPDTPNIDKEMENLENTSSTDDSTKKS